MAPELLRGGPYSMATDIYALGMIMWELAAGLPPFFSCTDESALLLTICDGKRPDIVDGTPSCWIALMESCWHADPNQRPSVADICEEVQTWLQCSKKAYQDNCNTIESI